MMDDNHKHDLEWTTSDAQICNKASRRTRSKVTEAFFEEAFLLAKGDCAAVLGNACNTYCGIMFAVHM